MQIVGCLLHSPQHFIIRYCHVCYLEFICQVLLRGPVRGNWVSQGCLPIHPCYQSLQASSSLPAYQAIFLGCHIQLVLLLGWSPVVHLWSLLVPSWVLVQIFQMHNIHWTLSHLSCFPCSAVFSAPCAPPGLHCYQRQALVVVPRVVHLHLNSLNWSAVARYCVEVPSPGDYRTSWEDPNRDGHVYHCPRSGQCPASVSS